MKTQVIKTITLINFLIFTLQFLVTQVVVNQIQLHILFKKFIKNKVTRQLVLGY